MELDEDEDEDEEGERERVRGWRPVLVSVKRVAPDWARAVSSSGVIRRAAVDQASARAAVVSINQMRVLL